MRAAAPDPSLEGLDLVEMIGRVRAAAPDSDDEAPASSRHKSTERKKWILIVDDDGDLRDMLAELLRDAGYSVSTASDGEKAKRLLDREYLERDYVGATPLVPDLLLLDNMMPNMSGQMLFAILFQFPQYRDLCRNRTVVLSAYGNLDGYPWVLSLAKPIDPAELLRVVANKIAGAE